MTFKITVETNDLAGVEAIVNQLHSLEQQGANANKTLSVSPQEVQQNTTQIYPPEQAPIQQIPVSTPQFQPQSQMYETITPVPQQSPTQLPPQPVQTVMPTAVQAYSMEQLAIATTPIIDSGRRQDVLNILTNFGCSSLMQLPKEQYGAFAQGLRSLGAKI